MHYTDESPMLMDYLAIFRVSLRDWHSIRNKQGQRMSNVRVSQWC
jgi:hypothetical protein